MKNQIVSVTPDLAKSMLKANVGNRPLRRSVVQSLKGAFARGEYVQTHQGIAFADDGTLLDGQHRLTAISELPSGQFEMLVSYGVPKQAFMVMDTGAKRTVSDALSEDRRLVAIASLAERICSGSPNGRATSYLVQPFIEPLKPYFELLMSRHSGNSKFVSNAPVLLAATISMMKGDKEYVLTMYKNLAIQNLFDLPPIGCAFVRLYLNGTLNTSNKPDTIARSLDVFDKSKSQNTKIVVHDQTDGYTAVRKALEFIK